MSNKLLKTHIINKISSISDHNSLVQIEYFLDSIKPKSNKRDIFKFAGIVSKEDGDEMQRIIDKEFNKIEGEW